MQGVYRCLVDLIATQHILLFGVNAANTGSIVAGNVIIAANSVALPVHYFQKRKEELLHFKYDIAAL